MKYLYTLFIFGLLASPLYSQASDCDCENRYQSEIFNNVSVETEIFSELYDLDMQIYTPVDDTCNNRPVLIFAHGGSFLFGDSYNTLAVDICETFARRGYVAVSINYRKATHPSVLGEDWDFSGSLGGLNWYYELEDGIKVVYSAFSDAKAAIRFLRKSHNDGNIYGINPNQIWYGGNSAGAVLGPHIAYIDSSDEFVSGIDQDGQAYVDALLQSGGGIEGDSGNPNFSSSVSGLINLAGAIHNLDWIDNNDTTPIVSCHGTEDETVPDECGTVLNSPTSLTVCGSIAMEPVLNQNSIVNDLLIYDGAGHCPWATNNSDYNQMIDFVTTFVYQNLDCNSILINEFNFSDQLLYTRDILGRSVNMTQSGICFDIYQDGSVQKKYIIKK